MYRPWQIPHYLDQNQTCRRVKFDIIVLKAEFLTKCEAKFVSFRFVLLLTLHCVHAVARNLGNGDLIILGRSTLEQNTSSNYTYPLNTMPREGGMVGDNTQAIQERYANKTVV